MSKEIEEESETPGPRIVGLDSDDADALIGALSSDTARDVLGAIGEDPATPSEIAERLDTSIQNVRYHLEGLEEAGLIEVSDMRYSPKGREMNVYDLASGPVVVFPGESGDEGRWRRSLLDALAGIAAVGAGAAVLQRVWTTFGGRGAMDAGAGDGGGAGGAAGPSIEEQGDDAFTSATANGSDDGGNMTERAIEEDSAPTQDAGAADGAGAPEAADAADATAATDPLTQLVDLLGEPGVAFFLGGLVAVAVAALIRYRWGD